MPPLRNGRQELFAQGIAAEGKTVGQAYVDAGFKRSVSNADRLVRYPAIRARIAEIQGNRELVVTKTTDEAIKAQRITIETILEELNEAYTGARDAKKFDAMVRATLGKARVCGLLIDRAEIKPVSNFSGMTQIEIGEQMIGSLIDSAERLGLNIETASLGEFLIGLQDEIMGVDDDGADAPRSHGQPHWSDHQKVRGVKSPGFGKALNQSPVIVNGKGRR